MSEQPDYFSAELDTSTLQGRAVRGAVYTTVSQGVNAVLSLVSQLVLSHLLFPAQFGIVAMVTPVVAFVWLFNTLGLSQAIIQRQELSQRDVSALYWLGLGASVRSLLLWSAPRGVFG